MYKYISFSKEKKNKYFYFKIFVSHLCAASPPRHLCWHFLAFDKRTKQVYDEQVDSWLHWSPGLQQRWRNWAGPLLDRWWAGGLDPCSLPSACWAEGPIAILSCCQSKATDGKCGWKNKWLSVWLCGKAWEWILRQEGLTEVTHGTRIKTTHNTYLLFPSCVVFVFADYTVKGEGCTVRAIGLFNDLLARWVKGGKKPLQKWI